MVHDELDAEVAMILGAAADSIAAAVYWYRMKMDLWIGLGLVAVAMLVVCIGALASRASFRR